MNWVVELTLGLVAIITIILGLLAVIQRTRDPVAWSFATIMVAAAGWAGGIALFYGADSVEAANWAVRAYYISAALIALAIVYLALSIARKTQKINNVFYYILAIPYLLIVVGFLFIPQFYLQQVTVDSVTLNLFGYLFYVIYFLVYYCFALAILTSSFKHSRGIERARLKYLLVGYTIGGAIGMTFNLVLPVFGNYQYVWAGPLGLFIFIPMIYVTIVKYGLFDIRQAAARTTAYASTLAVIAIAYAFIVTSLSSAIAGNTLVQTILILAAALSFQPVKLFFNYLTDTIFYKNTYNADEFYSTLNEQLTSTTDLSSLLRHTAALIKKTLKTQQAFLFVYTDEGQYITEGTEGFSKLPYADAELLGAYSDDLIIADGPGLDETVYRLLRSHKIALVLKLKSDNEVRGLLCLGTHLTSHFSNRDIKVLNTIADSLAIAIQNAVSVHEVRELNDTLQQRIDNATRELRRSNAQLQRLDEAKDEFISMASHQLRTPLTSIKGYLSMLIEGDLGEVTKDQKHVLNEAFISSERMVRLIGDFLNVSRLQTGKFVIEKHPVDLAQLVQRELEALESNAAARDMKFVYKKPKNIPKLELDENKIEQVVMNFADNAIYYAKEKSKITVTLKKVGEFVEFTVKDTGIGVPKADQQHLFTKFYRASNARKARPDGTGVGLFLAKKVIDDHNGSIVFSSVEGKGSTFGFRLPLPKTTKK